MVTEKQIERAKLAIKENSSIPTWVNQAREKTRILKALVNGTDYADVLIENIEKIESKDRQAARRKYSKDIRDMFNRVFKNRYNVFEAAGGSEFIKTDSEAYKSRIEEILSSFKGNKSLEKYLADYAFNLWDIEPNALFFVEYQTTPELKVYPTFKSINDIQNYKSEGQKLEWVLFSPKKKIENNTLNVYWRYVDAECDITLLDKDNVLVVVEEKSFTHPFKQVPAVIISDNNLVGSEIRISPVEQISELAKDYARDKSILTIYKFLNGFPVHWRYVQQCRTCTGTGKTGQSKCSTCDGKGILGRSDVTDMVQITTPREGDPVLTPNIAGYVNPSLETWQQYNEDQKIKEELIFYTVWGTKEKQENNRETATGRYIDSQPISNELSKYSSNIEYIHNQLAKFVIRLITNSTDAVLYHKSYGKRFIIESPDTILVKYTEAKEKGDPSIILDRLLNEFIVSKYRSDQLMMSIQLKKSEIEPYIHWDLMTIKDSFGSKEASKKIMFQEWWRIADHSKEINILKNEFKSYIKENESRFNSSEQVPTSN